MATRETKRESNFLGFLPEPLQGKERFYSLEDGTRKHSENAQKDKKRQCFEIDKARIIHSGAFRRLQAKTQVLGVGKRDFYRTRLTHSLEVAQLGRGMCRELKRPKAVEVDPELVEAVCLAHDIGHPPFGHSGEEHLHALLLKDGGFGANPQNIRIVTVLEQKHPQGGLNLSRAALDGLIKYPNLYDEKLSAKSRNFTYGESHGILKWAKQGRTERSIECQIADWADAVAYSVDDIEDALRAGLLDLNELDRRAEEISKHIKAKLAKEKIEDDPKLTDASGVRKEQRKLRSIVMSNTFTEKKRRLKSWTSETIGRLLGSCEIVERDSKATSNRYRYGLRVSDDAKRLSYVLKIISRILVFDDPRVVTLEAKGRYILERLFKAFCEDQRLLPLDFQEYIREGLGSPVRLVADFVSGMTDQYAFGYYSRLFDPGEGSFYEDV